MTLTIGLTSATGRMAQLLIAHIHRAADLRLGLCRSREQGSPHQTADLEACVKTSEVVVDFSHADLLPLLLEAAVQWHKPLVIGTTGLTPAHYQQLQKASQQVAIVQATNMSLGVAVLSQLVQQAARLLPPTFDIEILERHHRHKKDAPSGTSLTLGKAAAAGRGWTFMPCAHSEGLVEGGARPPESIGFAVSRGGGVSGDHEVDFISEAEMVSLSHRALDRGIFAEGALTAARWVLTQQPGLYNMQDVLGLPRGG